MTTQKQKNRIIIIAITMIFVFPLSLAWLFLQNPQWTSERQQHNGTLIDPPINLPNSLFIGFDPFSSEHMQELRGRWVMLNIVTGDDCDDYCKDVLHKTKQLRLMLDKDLTRVRRAVILSNNIELEKTASWWKQDPLVIRVRYQTGLINILEKSTIDPLHNGMIFLIDPLGNLMMWYPNGFNPYLIKKDLKKLLRASQIG